MSLLRLLAILITSLWLLSACGAADDESLLSIGGGVTADENTDSIVRIAHKNQAICSGVLVAKDLIITAAHCLKSDDVSAYSIVFPLAPSDKIRTVAEFKRVREDSLLYFPNFDIAWIRLDDPAPSGYSPAALLGDTTKVATGAGLTLVGAANETPCHPSDTNCQLVKLGVTLKSSWSSPHLINLAVVDSANASDSSGTCPGDSGGPAFVHLQGKPLVYGIVAGKDPIFTGGNASSCGSPTSVLTRIGEYQTWIESTSGRKLTVVNPSSQTFSLSFLESSSDSSASYTSWLDWFTKPLPSDSAWTTVHKILEQAVLEFQGQITQAEIPVLFQKGGQSWIEQLSVLKSLTLGFPDQAIAVDDLRPLVALKNLTDLTFLARDYKGLNVLERMPKLTSLSIVGRVVVRNEQGIFPWASLSSPYLTSLRLSQIAASQIGAINGTKLPNLKSFVVSSPLGKVSSSLLHEEKLSRLTTLQIQEFSCDQAEWPKVSLPNLKSLSLKSTVSLPESEIACIRWDLLPGLTELSVQGYHINVSDLTSSLPQSLAEQVRKQNP